MSKVTEILVKRDGYTEEEAARLVDDVRYDIMHSSPLEADEIIMSELGLEPDYLMDILLY